MADSVYEAFLATQYEQGMRLSAESDVLDLISVSDGQRAPDRYMATLRCTGAFRDQKGQVIPLRAYCLVGIAFPPDYLRHVDPRRIVTWLGPGNIVHPNIFPPVICVGRIVPGTELVDLLYQLFEIVTYVKWASHDYLNPDGASWARNNQHLFPLDRHPLKRRLLDLHVQPQSKEGSEQ